MNIEKVFCHIPKTGGTSFRVAFEQICNQNNIKLNFDNYGGNIIPDVGHYSDQHKRNILTVGHHSFKVCYDNKNSLYFVILRDPIKRIISHFLHLYRSHIIHNTCSLNEIFIDKEDIFFSDKIYTAEYENLNRKYSIASSLHVPPAHRCRSKNNCVHSQSMWFSNYYVKFIGGRSVLDTKHATQAQFDKVKKHIEKNELCFTDDKGNNIIVPVVFGITENLFETTKLFIKHIGGIDDSNFKKTIKENIAPNKTNVTDDLISKIAEHNKMDIELYNLIKSKFNKNIKV